VWTLPAVVFVIATAAASPTKAELPAYELELKDGLLIPETIVVNAGQRFKLNIRNTGKGPVEFESTRLRQEKVLGPGAHSFVVIPPLTPGEYEFFDEFHLPDATGRIIAK